jgi:hypothetical protein
VAISVAYVWIFRNAAIIKEFKHFKTTKIFPALAGC